MQLGRRQAHRKFGTAVLVAGFLAATGATLLAHSPAVVAEIICDQTSGLVISYNAYSVVEGQGHPRIDIEFNGQLVDSQAFTAPDYEFFGTAPLPDGSQPGDVIQVLAIAQGPWDNGTEGGQGGYAYVTVPDGECTGLGRFTGGGSQIRLADDVRVTRGLTIHCDLTLSNNLEVNWEGNHFHMLEHLVTVACTDSDDILEDPPPAPLDTLVGVGTGRYNGVDGYTIEFTMVDHGEPGRNDEMSILIYRTADPTDVVLNVPIQTLSGGNLQAHYDQPHGNKK